MKSLEEIVEYKKVVFDFEGTLIKGNIFDLYLKAFPLDSIKILAKNLIYLLDPRKFEREVNLEIFKNLDKKIGLYNLGRYLAKYMKKETVFGLLKESYAEGKEIYIVSRCDKRIIEGFLDEIRIKAKIEASDYKERKYITSLDKSNFLEKLGKCTFVTDSLIDYNAMRVVKENGGKVIKVDSEGIAKILDELIKNHNSKLLLL